MKVLLQIDDQVVTFTAQDEQRIVDFLHYFGVQVRRLGLEETLTTLERAAQQQRREDAQRN